MNYFLQSYFEAGYFPANYFLGGGTANLFFLVPVTLTEYDAFS